ncbi:hypothetical protein [Flagellimonas sp.]|uniref:hypothetical protein n=1 Tax=Flagellimonas sp. TaxID=2058762 RepID=UPI003F4A2BAE
MQDSFTMVDESTEDFTVFLTKKSDISAYHFTSSLEKKGRLFSKQLPNKYKLPIGGTINGSKYTLFYSNQYKSKFAGIVFDFETRWSKVFEIDLKLTNEIYLTRFNHSNTFHILTTSYRKEEFYLYIFDNVGNYKRKVIDLSPFEFLGQANYPTRLKHLLAIGTTVGITDLKLVEDDIPYSLDSMVSLYKLYIVEGKMYLTVDLNNRYTQIITYDLKKDVSGFLKIPQPELKKESKSNSYLMGNDLFQFKINPQEMRVRITDLQAQKTLKEYSVSKSDSLYISQGPIRQRGGRFDNSREFDRTSKFLRKVSSGNPGILVHKSEEGYEINIGSVEEITDPLLTTLALVNPISAVAVFGSFTLVVNPVALAFYKVSNSRAVYIFSLLDENFELKNGNEPKNIFYTIDDYIVQEGLKRFTAADVFSYQGGYVFGRLDKKTKVYSFLKF